MSVTVIGGLWSTPWESTTQTWITGTSPLSTPQERIDAALDTLVDAARAIQSTTDALRLDVDESDITNVLLSLLKKRLDAIER